MAGRLRTAALRAAGSILSEARAVQWGRSQKDFQAHEIARAPCGEAIRLWIADTDARDWYESSSYLQDRWPEMEFVRDRLVRRGDVVIECGTHQGITAILLSRWVGPTGKIIGIDPVQHNIDVAERNLDINGVANVDLLHAAVSDRMGRVRIGGGTNVQIGIGLRGESVDAIVLDQFVGERPTLIKLDIEGAEGLAFAGGQRVLDLKPRIALELHDHALPKFGTRSSEILGMIWSRGYDTWVLWDDLGVPEPLPVGTSVDRRVHVFAFPQP